MEEKKDDFLKKLEANDIKIISKKEVSMDCPIRIDVDSMLGVRIDEFTKHDVFLNIKSSRGANYYIDLFEDDNRFCLKIMTDMPKAYYGYHHSNVDNDTIANTFADFCWIYSEGTNDLNKDEVDTHYRDGVVLGDLTWVLPSKFSDDIIEVLHIFNQRVANGILEDAIIYGPFYSI